MTDSLVQQDRNYYISVRTFENGTFEALTKVVRPMAEQFITGIIEGDSYRSYCAEHDLPCERKPRVPRETELSEYEKSKNHERAVRHAKQMIRYLTKQIGADRLFTLTYRENIEDRDRVKAHFTRFLRLVRTGFSVRLSDGSRHRYAPIPDWKYVAVLEKQQRGSYHIHCAVKGFQRIKTLRAAWQKALGGNGDETGSSTLGNVDVTSPTTRWGSGVRQWATTKLAGYLTKYLHKTFDEETCERRRYWRSMDIPKPVVERYWIGGSSIVEAIKSSVSMLSLHVGLCDRFDMWLSPYEDTFWISGQCD